MKDLLLSAKHEIEGLRRRNEILGAKVEMIDLFACVLQTEPARRSQSESIDVAWELQQAIDEIEHQERAMPAAENSN